MKNIILIGAGGHCKSCVDVIEKEKKYKIVGLIDNKKKGFFLKYKILGKDKELKNFRALAKYALVTVGQIKDFSIRLKLFIRAINYNFVLPSIVSPLSSVSKYSLIKEGSIIMNRCIVNAHSVIGKNCIINTGAIIEHDVSIGNNCHISTGVIVNGEVKIGNNTFIGSGTVIKNKVKIGSNCIIGMKKVIKNNIKDNKILK
jgi:sugar O-acyltransferase (sialic acid O-acetyltransferase NeuD family)